MNFLFPIETTARELDYKVLVAVAAAQKNRSIIIGEQQLIRNLSFFLKCGVFFGKHLFGKHKFSDQNYYNRLKRNHFSVVHLNEEGAIWPGSEEDWKRIMLYDERPSVLSETDFLLEWGRFQYDFYSNLEPHTTNIRVTGHPRFDLLKPKYNAYYDREVREIKEKFKNYVLINTSTSFSNNGTGGNKFTFKKTMFYDPANKEQRRFRFGKWARQSRDMTNVIELINELSSSRPEKTFIIRPHPSENTDFYTQIFQNINNVKVIYDGSAVPWMLGCDALIHISSTTAIEAALASKPVINYKPDGNSEYDVRIANIVGSTCKTPDEVQNCLNQIENGAYRASSDELPIYAKELLENFEGYSIQRILKILDEAEEAIMQTSIKKSGLNLKFLVRFLAVANSLYLFFKYSYLSLLGRWSDYIDFKKRFQPLNLNQLKEKVKSSEMLLGKKVRITYVNKYLFLIECEG